MLRESSNRTYEYFRELGRAKTMSDLVYASMQYTSGQYRAVANHTGTLWGIGQITPASEDNSKVSARTSQPKAVSCSEDAGPQLSADQEVLLLHVLE
jgi:hypothetical protein